MGAMQRGERALSSKRFLHFLLYTISPEKMALGLYSYNVSYGTNRVIGFGDSSFDIVVILLAI
jgi:hypothetical protein